MPSAEMKLERLQSRFSNLIIQQCEARTCAALLEFLSSLHGLPSIFERL